MAKYSVGDRVLVNSGLVATITHYDPDTNWMSYESNVGGATNVYSSHISNTHLEPLSGQTVEELEPELHDQRDAVVNEGPADKPERVKRDVRVFTEDQINTLDNQQ
jgi:hypothetical protein